MVPHEVKPIHQLEMVQRRAARWTLNRHHNTSSVKGMLEDLQWRTLEQRRTDCRLVLLFQIIHGLVQIPPTNYLQPSLNTTSRKNHNYTYQQCSTRTNYFKYSFFPYTTVVWNNLPYQLVNSPSVKSWLCRWIYHDNKHMSDSHILKVTFQDQSCETFLSTPRMLARTNTSQNNLKNM